VRSGGATATLGDGPCDAVLSDRIRVAVSKLLVRTGDAASLGVSGMVGAQHRKRISPKVSVPVARCDAIRHSSPPGPSRSMMNRCHRGVRGTGSRSLSWVAFVAPRRQRVLVTLKRPRARRSPPLEPWLGASRAVGRAGSPGWVRAPRGCPAALRSRWSSQPRTEACRR
jgi:hypothetical protein